MKPTTIVREEALKKILNKECEDIQDAAFKNDMSYVSDILSSGIKGYLNFTNKELGAEISAQFGKPFKVIGK